MLVLNIDQHQLRWHVIIMMDVMPVMTMPAIPQVNAVRLAEAVERVAPLVASTQSRIPGTQTTSPKAATPTPYVTYNSNGKSIRHSNQRKGEQLDETV